ncbi:MAG: hypothetical protein JO102_04115, partial [Elusimicrobia bacterium]|nr:hypothetical protein [Elusimicrobiota bacterium]
MEFEILNDPENPPGPLEAVRRFLSAPRRQVQAWGERAPKRAGLGVFALVALECALAHRLEMGQGRGRTILAQIAAAAAVLFVAELLISTAAAAVASFTKKTGSRTLTIFYLHLGLSPLLLYLPLTLILQLLNAPDILQLLLFVILCLKVGTRWREIIETTYKLTSVQSVIAFYAAGVFSILILFLTAYAALVGRLAA